MNVCRTTRRSLFLVLAFALLSLGTASCSTQQGGNPGSVPDVWDQMSWDSGHWQ